MKLIFTSLLLTILSINSHSQVDSAVFHPLRDTIKVLVELNDINEGINFYQDMIIRNSVMIPFKKEISNNLYSDSVFLFNPYLNGEEEINDQRFINLMNDSIALYDNSVLDSLGHIGLDRYNLVIVINKCLINNKNGPIIPTYLAYELDLEYIYIGNEEISLINLETKKKADPKIIKSKPKHFIVLKINSVKKIPVFGNIIIN